MAQRQANSLQRLGLVRIVAAEHARALNLDLKVTLFTQTGTGLRTDIQCLLDCLHQVWVVRCQQVNEVAKCAPKLVGSR